MSELFDEVAGLVSIYANVPAAELRPESRFEELTHWTSYNALRLLAGVEEEFKVRLDLRGYLATEDLAGLVTAIAAAS
jgi:acyl carrier protein